MAKIQDFMKEWWIVTRAGEPEPGAFGSLEPRPEPVEKKKPGAGAAPKKRAGAASKKNEEPEQLEKKEPEPLEKKEEPEPEPEPEKYQQAPKPWS